MEVLFRHSRGEGTLCLGERGGRNFVFVLPSSNSSLWETGLYLFLQAFKCFLVDFSPNAPKGYMICIPPL